MAYFVGLCAIRRCGVVVLVVCVGCVSWLCVVIVCVGCVSWLCVVIVCVGCVSWLCACCVLCVRVGGVGVHGMCVSMSEDL